MSDFNRYHKIPNRQKFHLPPGKYTVQEKVDGANSGIQLSSDQTLILHSRNTVLAHIHINPDYTVSEVKVAPEYGDFSGFVQMVKNNAGAIYSYMLENNYTNIYGEWLVPHTIKYSEDRYKKFYLFDAVNTNGVFTYPAPPPDMLHPVKYAHVELTDDSPADKIRQVTLQFQDDLLSHRIEGTVWKRYDLDALNATDDMGQRFCYKDVLPEFREENKKNPMFARNQLDILTTEEKLVQHLPERSLEKVYEKLVTSKGGWNNSLIPVFIGMVWQEFFEEHLIPALQTHKMPIVNTNHLKQVISKRAREFALERSV